MYVAEQFAITTTDALAEGVYMVRFSGDPGQVVRRLVVAR